MEQIYLKFPRNEWGIVVVLDFDVESEYDVLYEQIRSFGVKPKNIDRALAILSSYNTGMCVSNKTLKMSAVYISKATSPEQFWDTVAHEFAHCVTAIIDTYDVPCYSEDAAYLSGFIMRQFVSKVGEPCV